MYVTKTLEGFIGKTTRQMPVLLDEIQYAPGLLPYIKMTVDKAPQAGMFWMTGSQQFQLVAGVSESLAGRVGIINLLGLSHRATAQYVGAGQRRGHVPRHR